MPMTDDELRNLQAELTKTETEIAALSQAERECIDKAREFNEATRKVRNQRTALNAVADKFRAAINQEVAVRAIEAKRLLNEQRAAETAAKEQSENDRLREENEALKQQLAAKE